MPLEPLVCAAVLAWNHQEETLAAVESLLASDYPRVLCAVVDNGSTDGTAEAVAARYPQVALVRSPTNLGIAAGYNLGMDWGRRQGADYILVANNDIVVDPAMVRNLVQALEDRPQAGMALPKIYHFYGDRSRLWCTGVYWRRFPPTVKMVGVDTRDAPRYATIREIQYAPSCCLLIRSEAEGRVGGFDTGYFFYNSDWDYSARMRGAGYSIWFVPDARMWHKVSVSTQRSSEPARWWYNLGRSTVKFYRQYSTPAALYTYSLWFAVRECIKLQFRRVPPFLTGVVHQMADERQQA